MRDGQRVMAFNTMEEMYEHLREAEARADASLVPAQRGVTWGDYWISHSEGYAIFGWVFTEEEADERERAAGADEEEARYAAEHLRESHEKNRLYGLCFSVVEPRGELGSTHRASVWPLPEPWFNAARLVGWDAEAMMRAVREASG